MFCRKAELTSSILFYVLGRSAGLTAGTVVSLKHAKG